MKSLNCPKGHGSIGLKTMIKDITFKGVNLTIETEAFVCPVCGLEAGTATTAGKAQQRIADAYRKKQIF